nr:hypothetical protein [uncultured Rhodopila sp.]
MADILIRGGNSEAAALEISAAIDEIFGERPTRMSDPRGQKVVTRGFVEAALIVLALPPAAVGTADLVSRVRLGERFGALIRKIAEVGKTTKSSVMIDPGNGKHIPLEEASRDAILAALAAMEEKLKGQVAGSSAVSAPPGQTGSRDLAT